jgi:integrase
MASINVRKDTGKLYLDFRYRNIRCRELTALNDTVANRRKLKVVLDKIQAEILLGTFDYEKTFPNSAMIKKLRYINQVVDQQAVIPLFEAFAKTWFEEMQVQWRFSYISAVNNIIFNRLIPVFGKYPVDKITKAQVLAFRVQISEFKKRNGDTLSPTSVNRHMKILRAILNEAADRFEFSTPYRGIKPLKVPKSHIKPFTPEEIQKILNHVREDFKDYFTVRFFTGMRTGEVDGLKWKYVDLEQRLISVRETIVSGREEYTKNSYSQRDIQMSDHVYRAFCNMKKRTGDNTFVFCNQKGNPLDHNHVTKRIWYPLLKHLGLEKRNPYQMRHTAATLWLAAGELPEWIAYQMGHSTTEMLFRVYSRYVPNLTRKDGSAAEKLFSRIVLH